MSDPGARTVSRRPLVVGAVGFLVVVVGLVVALTTGAEPVVGYEGSYAPTRCAGWPVCDEPPWTVAVTAGQIAGLALAVGGALVLAVLAGWLWRHAADRQP